MAATYYRMWLLDTVSKKRMLFLAIICYIILC